MLVTVYLTSSTRSDIVPPHPRVHSVGAHYFSIQETCTGIQTLTRPELFPFDLISIGSSA